MNEYKFKSYGVDYIFLEYENIMIPPFGWYMNIFSNENWERDTFDTFNQVKDPTKIALDIGGWIGSTAIWLSKHFEKVVVVEADKNAIVALKNNLKTNSCDNVDLFENVIYNKSQKTLFFGYNPHTSSQLGDSTSSSKTNSKNSSDYIVEAITLESLISNYPKEKISFLKIDIEGGEEHIMEDLFELGALYKWKVWLSFHYGWWENKDLNRFENLFKTIKKLTFCGQEIKIEDFSSYISNNHLGTFYLEF